MEPASQEVTTDASVYLTKLAMLAHELEVQGAAGSLGAVKLLRQRLKEWVEDLRSVGGHDALADAVTVQIERLTSAIASGTLVPADVLDIAAVLAKVATGSPLPPRTSGRGAFWK